MDYPSYGLSKLWIIQAMDYPSYGLSKLWIIQAMDYPGSGSSSYHEVGISRPIASSSSILSPERPIRLFQPANFTKDVHVAFVGYLTRTIDPKKAAY